MFLLVFSRYTKFCVSTLKSSFYKPFCEFRHEFHLEVCTKSVLNVVEIVVEKNNPLKINGLQSKNVELGGLGEYLF